MQVRSGSGTWIRRLGLLVLVDVLFRAYLSTAALVEVVSDPVAASFSAWVASIALLLVPLMGLALVKVFRLDLEAHSRLHQAETELDGFREVQLEQVRIYREKVDRITRAIEDRTLVMHYQPIIHLPSGRPHIFEALCRFDDGRAPDEWFSEAFDVGLGVDLELAAVLRAASDLPLLPEGTFMSVNVSAGTLTSTQLLLFFLEQEVEASRVIIELTEERIVENYEATLRAMNKLRRLGLSFAVDDAGSGYAGVRQMVSLQPEWIKVDRSIVAKLDSDSARRAAVRSLAQFAKDANMNIIAEGLETETERLVLEHLGVDYAQGYLVGRPAPLSINLDRGIYSNPV